MAKRRVAFAGFTPGGALRGSHLTRSVAALLTAIGLLCSVTFAMVHRSIYGYRMATDIVGTVVSIGCGAVLQMLAKHKGFHASANSRDECSLLTFSPSLLLWMTGEASTFLTGAILVLRWRRKPPMGLPAWAAVGLLVGVGVGVYFLISLAIAPALGDAFGFNATDASGLQALLNG